MTEAEEPREALHYSEGKEGVDQIPPELLMEWGRVFNYGEKKYRRDNWKLGTEWYQFYGSALRHLYRFWMGEDIDPESGLPHLAHAMWNVGCLRYYQLRNLGHDSREVVDTIHIEPPVANHDEAFVIGKDGIVGTQKVGTPYTPYPVNHITFLNLQTAYDWMQRPENIGKRLRVLDDDDGLIRVWEE